MLIEGVLPRSDDCAQPIGRGSNGSIMLGYCDEIFVVNNSLTPYLVELRHASGAHTP